MEVIVVADGNPESRDTWSNVPYFLVNSLRDKNVTVHTVDIGLNSTSTLKKFLLRVIKAYYLFRAKIDNHNNEYSVIRTRFYIKIVEEKIKQAIKDNPNVKAIVFTSFSFIAPSDSGIKSILVCDWPIDYYIENMLERNPGKLEARSIREQHAVIQKADCVVTLFPMVKEYMEKRYGRKVEYFGHIINSDCLDLQVNNSFENKYQNNHYLFIGRKKYLRSCVSLIKACTEYNIHHEDKIYADIVGIESDDLPQNILSKYVNVYGYLSKDEQSQRDQYYKLILGAKSIVNTTEKWGGASSIVEAMYYGTPFILAKNQEIEEMFGKKPKCGYYCLPANAADLLKVIEQIQNLDIDSYRKLCVQSHNIVKDYTWEKFADKLIDLVK